MTQRPNAAQPIHALAKVATIARRWFCTAKPRELAANLAGANLAGANLACESDATRRRALGAVGLAMFLLHAAHQFHLGHTEHLFWTCPVANLLVGIGLLTRCRSIWASGVFMLCVGIPVYVLHLLNGGEHVPATGVLIHFGGLGVGLWAIAFLGIGRRDWMMAFLIVLLVLALSRQFTPMHYNVNFAFRSVFSKDPTRSSWSHLPYLCLGWALALWLSNRVLSFATKRTRRTGFQPVQNTSS